MPRLYKRGRVYYCDIFLDGKRVRRPMSTERRIAQEKMADLIKLRAGAKYGHAAVGINFDTFRSRLLEYSKARQKKVTYLQYVRALRDLSVGTVTQVTPEYVERVMIQWQTHGVGKYEINARLRSIKAAMRRAEAWGYSEPKRWNVVKPIKTPRGRLLFYSPDDVRRLLSKANGPWMTVTMLGVYAGLRRGEIAALRWEDVDFERNRLHIVAHDGFTPKDYERRWIPLAAPLRVYLRKLGKRGPAVLGRSYHPEVLSTYGRRLVRKARLAGSLHTLRHTFAAWLASAGIPLYTISKLLGHASVKTTEIYAHLAPESQEKAVTVLPDVVPRFGSHRGRK